MRMIWARVVMLLVLASFALADPAGAQAPLEKRIALVIGNSAYQAGALPTPANDAGLIAQTLQAAGFDVAGARDLDQDALRHSFRDFLDKAAASGPNTVVFVYLAGYGLQYEGDNYFAPVDAKIASATDVPVEAIRISDFTKSLATLQNKGSIIVLDAARANPFVRSDQPLAGGLAIAEPDPNVLIAFNAAPGTIAPQEPGPYGAYAHALAEMMRVGGMPLTDVFDRTRLRVSDATKGAELPWNAAKFRAPFVFFDRGPDAPAPQVSYEQSNRMRAKAIRDFDAQDAYLAALDRDTLRGYEDFLVAYPGDPMAKRVRAIVAARREAITWRQTWLADTPEAYWSYLRRYPRGPHGWDARRRLENFEASLEPPASFTVIEYDVPPPPEAEIVYVDRPVLYFDDPEFGFTPPPPSPVIFLPPPPPDFVVLAPPPRPVDLYALPVPAFVPVPEWVHAPHDVAPPENNVIFNNIHNTTINNVTTIDQAAPVPATPGLTTGQKLTGAAISAGATAAALHVALPPSVQKKAALIQKQNPVTATKPPVSGPAPALTAIQPPVKRPDMHTLPGANGQPLPLINGKPAVQGQVQTKTVARQTVPNVPGKANNARANLQTGHPLPGANGQALPVLNGKLAVKDQAQNKSVVPKAANNVAGKSAIPGQSAPSTAKGETVQNAVASPAKRKIAAGKQTRGVSPVPGRPSTAPNQPHLTAQGRPPAARLQTHAQIQPRMPAQARPQVKKPQATVRGKPGLKKLCGSEGLPACSK
jgi:uncharacterized caspase-like protein